MLIGRPGSLISEVHYSRDYNEQADARKRSIACGCRELSEICALGMMPHIRHVIRGNLYIDRAHNRNWWLYLCLSGLSDLPLSFCYETMRIPAGPLHVLIRTAFRPACGDPHLRNSTPTLS